MEAGGSSTSSMIGKGKMSSAGSRYTSACDNARPPTSQRQERCRFPLINFALMAQKEIWRNLSFF